MKGKLILPYIMTNMATGVGSAVMFWYSGYDPIWIGTFFATFTMPFFLMVLAGALGISKTSKNLPVIQLINLAAVAFVAYTLFGRGGPSTTAEYVSIGLAVYGALTMQWYIHIFSNYSFRPDQISSTAQTFTSTKPKSRAISRMVSWVISVGTLAAFFGHDAQTKPICVI